MERSGWLGEGLRLVFNESDEYNCGDVEDDDEDSSDHC